MLRVSRMQAVNYRLVVNNLSTRLSAGSYVEAAYVGLQDTAPRDALLGLHARVEACEPSAWQHPGLIQTYSPRAAVYVLPADDFGVFTVGRLPRDPQARQVLEDLAEESCRCDGRPGGARPRFAREGRLRDRPDRGPVDDERPVRAGTRTPVDRSGDGPDGAVPPARARVWSHHSARLRLVGWRVGAGCQEDFDLIAGELLRVDLAGHDAWVLAADESALEVGRARAWGPAAGRVGPAPVRAGPRPALRWPGQE